MATVIRINGTSQELKYRWITVLALIEFAKELKHSLQISHYPQINYLLRILKITAVGKGGCNKIITCY